MPIEFYKQKESGSQRLRLEGAVQTGIVDFEEVDLAGLGRIKV